MTGIPTDAEKIAVEANLKKFDMDKALNMKGFAEFLADHPDAESFDMNDEVEVEKRLEVFKNKEEVTKEIQSIFSGHIEKEMGIKLDGNDRAAIEEHLYDEAIDSPESLVELKNKLKEFKELPLKIKACEVQLAALAKEPELKTMLEGLQTEKNNLEVAKKYSGISGKFSLGMDKLANFLGGEFSEKEGIELNTNLDALKAVKEKHGKVKDFDSLSTSVAEQIKAVEKTLATIKELEDLKKLSEESFAAMRKDLVGNISNIEEVKRSIQEKVAGQFRQMMETGTVKSLDQAQIRLEELKKISETSDTGIDLLENTNTDHIQELIDTELDRMALEQIYEKIDNAKMGENTFTKLEKSLEPFLTKEKIGSREGDEAREVIIGALNEAFHYLDDNAQNTTEGRAKKLMISRLIIKMKK